MGRRQRASQKGNRSGARLRRQCGDGGGHRPFHLVNHGSGAALYEEAGILLLVPGATSPSITEQGHRLVFRTIPNDQDAGRQLGNFVSTQGFRRIGLCYVDDEYGNALIKIFEGNKIGSGQIVERLPYTPGKQIDFSGTLEGWGGLNLDVIILVATMPQGAHFIAQARALGLDMPIIGADGLDSAELWQIAGQAAEGVIIFSVFHPGASRTAVRTFVKDFKARFNQTPDVWAALGYDTVQLLAHAVQETGNTAPRQLAGTLRRLQNWSGVTGPMAFSASGDLKYKPIVRKVVRDGRLDFLEDGMLR